MRTLRWLGWLALDQWFVIGIAVVIVIASQVQVPLDKQELRQTIVSYGAVAAIFLITGLGVSTKVLFQNYKRWKVHLYVQIQCFLVTSAIVFGVVSAAATNRHFMDDGLLCGMILLGSLATTLSSNVIMTTQAHGNTALTVVETTIGNFIGPFLTPVLFKMYTLSGVWYTHFFDDTTNGGFGEVYQRVFKLLGFSVYLPFFVGQVVRNINTKVVDTILVKYKVKKFSSVCLLLIIWQTFDQAFATNAFTSVPPSNIIFVVFMNIAFFLIWLLVCFVTSVPFMSKYDVISICYTVPAKTPAMGVPMADVIWAGLTLQQESKLQIPIVLFQGLQITMSSIMTIWMRKWIEPDERKAAAEAAAAETKTLNDSTDGVIPPGERDVEKADPASRSQTKASSDDSQTGADTPTVHDFHEQTDEKVSKKVAVS